ncbi:MAG: ParB/RepB/Spo0J family partition protein [Clostridia bacterium]|nr:ParB/RepB/Spo0J family partition protein [Clostridia bacterium]
MSKKKIEFPVLNVKMVDIEKVESNDYNPNRVATPEMELLKHSIEMDGYTQPIVAYYDKKEDKYIIVDGFHRYKCARLYFDLKEIPVVVINKDLKNRMASTIRHNRARGTHQIPNMSSIVIELTKLGWSEQKISVELGMELDEIVRLKQISGLKEAFADHVFSKSWEEFETKIQSDNQEKI